jgi:hypothetical protein
LISGPDDQEARDMTGVTVVAIVSLSGGAGWD